MGLPGKVVGIGRKVSVDMRWPAGGAPVRRAGVIVKERTVAGLDVREYLVDFAPGVTPACRGWWFEWECKRASC